MNWSEAETTTHQDHVIKHVIGATVLGWFVVGDAAHLLLDIGFLWTIYLDGEMNLLPQGVAISELEESDQNQVDRAELAFDADLLMSEGYGAIGLRRFTAAENECLIDNVEVFSANSKRQIVIRGEVANVVIETSPDPTRITVTSETM